MRFSLSLIASFGRDATPVKAHAEVRGRLLKNRGARGGNEEGAGRPRLVSALERRPQPVRLTVGLEHAVEHRHRVVLLVRHEEARGAGRVRERGGHRLRQLRSANLLHVRHVEAVENAVELHAHLVGERPTGVVVRATRRAAGIGEVVRVVLRLHHVEDLPARGLRRLDHERAGRIVLSRDGERPRRLVDVNADVAERVHELDRREEVRLIRRNDVAARIALVFRVEHVVVRVHLRFDVAVATAERRAGIPDRSTGLVPGWNGRGGGAATTTTSSPVPRRGAPACTALLDR